MEVKLQMWNFHSQLIEKIIIVSDIERDPLTPYQGIPEWLKTNAGWWANGEIDDKTFATGIEFLIKIGLIVV